MNHETMLLLEKQFDTAFAAHDGIQKLRELILTLAMQGKLVPQDPNDEPASELLKEIEVEKQRLVKDGKIKKPKPLLEIKADEIPYDLPNGWAWVRLGWITSKITDGDHQTPPRISEGYRLLSAKNVRDGYLDFDNCDFISEEHYLKSRERCCPELNDLLIVSVGGTIGRTSLIPKDSFFALVRSVALIKPLLINSPYLKYAMDSSLLQSSIHSRKRGGAQPCLYLSEIEKFLFSLPPLAEQRRIVAKIDQLMARCDELEKLRCDRAQKLITVHTAALNRLLTAQDTHDFNTAWRFITQHFGELYSVKETVAELRKTILQLAVMGKLVPQDPNDEPASELLKAIELEKQRLVKEEKIKKAKPLPEINPDDLPFDLPQSWEWIRFGMIVQSMTNGLYKPSHFYSDKGVKIVRMFNIQSGFLDLNEVKRIEVTQKELETYKLSLGDILVNRVNSLELIGKSALVVEKDVREELLFEAMNIRVCCFLRETNLPSYANLLLQNKSARSYFMEQAKRALGQVSINQPQVGDLLFPLPPLAEQYRIVAKVDQLMALCDRLEGAIAAAQAKQTDLLNAVMAQV